MYPTLLTNIEIQKYYQNERRSNGVYSRNDLCGKVKDEAYLINLDEYTDFETHCINLYALKKKVYFDSFGVKEIKTFIGNKNIKPKTFRM